MRRYLTRLAESICGRPWAFVIAGVVVAAAASFYAVRALEFKTSRNDLIGRDSEYWRLYSEYAREFRAEEDYIIVVEGDAPARNKATVDALVRALLSPANNPGRGDSPAAQLFVPDDVFYRVDFDAMKQWFLYYLPLEDLNQIRNSVKDFKQLLAILEHDPKLNTFFDAMNQMLRQMETASDAQRREMESFVPTITAIARQMGHFEEEGDHSELLSPWASAFFSEELVGEGEQQFKWQGYQAFQEGRMFILLIHPRNGSDGQPVSHAATIPKVRRIIATVASESPAVQINLTGEPVLDHDEMLVSGRDATKGTLLTLVLICVLFFFSFREVQRPALAVGAMVLVLGLSMGYAALTVGHLNIITVTFAVMILGLGIDLGIQFVARYEEELNRGARRTEAIAITLEHTGVSIITAGVTNAAAFFAMGLSGFRGVIELGIIAGGGMLIATMVTILVLPALLLVARRRTESTQIPAQATASRFEQLLLRRPYAMLAAFAVLTTGALLFGWSVRFDYNVLNLQSQDLPSVQTELRLLNADAESTIFASIVCDDFEQARTLHHSLTGLSTVATVHSIVELIPERQAEKAKIIRQIQKELGDVEFYVPAPDPADAELVMRSLASLQLRAGKLAREAKSPASERVLYDMVEALKQTRAKLQALQPTAFQQWLTVYQERFYADLEAQLQLMGEQVVDRSMTFDDVPKEVRPMLIGKTGKLLIRVFPKENIWEREALVRFVRDIQSVAPQVTGTPLGLFEFVDLLKRGYRNAALWALLVITILIFIDFRSPIATVFTILPLLVGIAWMLGVMAVFGVRFNPANIMTLPLMVGIGVAYGIYVVQRFRESGEATFYGKSTGRAVILSALTTIVAFASLLIGAHRGIRSLGLVMSIGVTACLIASIVLLPALLEISRRKGWKV